MACIIGASTNYTQRNARTNFAGKRQTGLSTNVNNNSDFDALTQQAFQVYGSFSSAAQGYQFTEDGSVGGEFLWIDNLYDSRWLSDQIQNSLATLISNSKNISYTSDGISKVEAVLNSVEQVQTDANLEEKNAKALSSTEQETTREVGANHSEISSGKQQAQSISNTIGLSTCESVLLWVGIAFLR